MRKVVVAACAAIVAASFPAAGQNYDLSSVSAAAIQVYASCESMSQRAGIAVDVRAACACLTGYVGGMMSDRDFEVAAFLLRVGEMTETGVPQAAIEAEIMAFFERGFTQADVQRVAAAVDAASARGDAICAQFEQTGSV
jgi:hypothetical protein